MMTWVIGIYQTDLLYIISYTALCLYNIYPSKNVFIIRQQHGSSFFSCEGAASSPTAEATPESKVHGPTWGPPGSCRAQVSPLLAPWTLPSRKVIPPLHEESALVCNDSTDVPTWWRSLNSRVNFCLHKLMVVQTTNWSRRVGLCCGLLWTGSNNSIQHLYSLL